MSSIEYSVDAVAGRVRLIVVDERDTSSPDTDDVEISIEFDGTVVIAAAFELSAIAALRASLTEILERRLPPANAAR